MGMRKVRYIIGWTLVGIVGLAIEVLISVWATQTEKDPNLEETAQFTPAEYPEIAARITPEALGAHIEALSSIPSRVAGTPGCDRAADYIKCQFRALGVGEPQAQEFPITAPMHDEAIMKTSVGDFPIHPLWPNGVCPPALPEEGLSTRLVYAGYGRLADVNGKDIAGSVVVVETGAREQWLYLIDLGAKAIIFVERERPPRAMAQFTQTLSHQHVPRFWMTSQEAQPLLEHLIKRDLEATLFCDARWEQRTAQNIWVDIPGVSTAPHNEDEIVVLEAYYDSSSFVPDLAPGAEQACGIAALLELAKIIRDHPFEKRVRLLATCGHFQALAGAREYVWEHVGRFDSPLRDVSPQGHAAFFGLDLSSNSECVGLFAGGFFFQQNANNLKPRLSDLGRRASKYADEIGKALAVAPALMFVDTINPLAGKDWPTYTPSPLALDHEAALLAGIPALSFVSTNDTRFFTDTPNDTEVRLDHLAKQVRLLACMLPNAFNVEGRYLKRSLPRSICRIQGRAVSFDPREGYLPNKPVPHALVVARPWGAWTPSLTGVSTRPMVMADDKGRFMFVGMGTNEEVPYHMCNTTFEPYVVEGGRITWGPDFGRLGKESYPITMVPVQKEMELTCVLFECKTLDIYNLFDPRNYNYLVNLEVLEAGSNSVPPVYGANIISPGWPSYVAPTVSVFAPAGARLKVTAGAGALHKRLTLLNVPETTPPGQRFNTGIGFSVDDTPAIYRAYLQGAEDMWRLNDSRIRFFGEHGVENARVNQLHQAARKALDEAHEAIRKKDYQKYFTDARRALSLESRAYPDVVGMANDTMRGLIFYLALLIPFAFAMERLFLAGRRVETRILGIIAFFLVMFFALRLTHPAFQIVLSPMVVLLGFVVAALSTVIILIVMARLEALVSKRKVEQEGEHESGVQAVSAGTLALEMGIANMRRRKARTLLTSITIIMLTFSVLSFASVTAEIRLQRYVYEEGATPYEGVLLRTQNWTPFPFETYASLRNELQDTCTLAPRRWYYGHLTLNQSSIDVKSGGTVRSLRAMIGLTAQEKEFLDIESALVGSSRWLSPEVPGQEPPAEVLLPLNLALEFAYEQLTFEEKVRIADLLTGTEVQLLGRAFRVMGVYDPDRLDALADPATHALAVYDPVLQKEKKDKQLSVPVSSELKASPYSFQDVAVISADILDGLGNLEAAPEITAGRAAHTVKALIGFSDQTARASRAKSALVGKGTWLSAVKRGEAPQAELVLPLNVAVELAYDQMDKTERIRIADAFIGRQVRLLGREFNVIGVFDWERMNDLTDIDGETLTPFDPVQMEKKAQEEGVPDPEEIQRYIHHSFKDVAITSERVLGNLGGDFRSIAIKPHDPKDLESLVQGLVRRMDYILFANLDGVPTLMSSRDATSLSRVWNLLILMLIAGLIVFNTMLGSVYERTKEIGTYTALGIAPSHIGYLFIAEAGVFAVIGVMAGYVLGQLVARVVHLWDVPVLSALSLNYSSFAGVFACALVMVMVMLSAAYPARKASQLGVPDIERRWKLPPTKETAITLPLPFTVSLREAQGLVAYLKEYLDSHVDVSVGNFYVENVKAGPEVADGNGTGVMAQFWLTPFDLGVSQYTTFLLRLLEGMDVCGVEVRIERLSGDASSWRRANGHFMTNMRGQFLIWRNLSPEVRAEYVRRGKEYAFA